MLTLTREESERDGSVEHGHGERELGGAPAMARWRGTRTVALPKHDWYGKWLRKVEEGMAE